jgi:DNA (cytosine-5)-methyltransferase 1
MAAYYNEIDPYAAQWLRNLIAAGHIADGDVDTRSIEDVRPEDIRGYTQCHFFAGVGVWSHALRRTGWTDDRPVWTGSCPCQPFSAAGKGAGFDDERHLWPAWYHLISECEPPVILGEQVASKDADPWVDLVQDDLEALGYSFGAVPFPAASIGAPNIRHRNYWMGHTLGKQRQRPADRPKSSRRHVPTISGADGRVADSEFIIHRGQKEASGFRKSEIFGSTNRAGRYSGASVRLVDTSEGQWGWRPDDDTLLTDRAQVGWIESAGDAERDRLSHIERPNPTNGYWADADWLGCWDGKWRPVEPGTFPLAHGAAARVGRLRAYGNAINAEQAKIFIETVMEIL